MPVWLTFFGALLAVVGFFGGLYFLITMVTEGWRAKAAPRFGIAKGNGNNVLNVWVKWDPKQFGIGVYRLRFQHVSPFEEIKEGTFTVTFDTLQNESFVQPVELPASFSWLFTSNASPRNIFTVQFKTSDEMTMTKEYRAGYVKKILNGLSARMPHIGKILPLAKSDHPTILTLDYSELEVWRGRLKELEAAAKAKAAKAAAAPKPAAAPAAKPAAATAAAPATPAAPAPKAEAAKAPAPEAAKPAEPVGATAAKPASAPQDVPVKSVRDVVSANNKKQVEKPEGST